MNDYLETRTLGGAQADEGRAAAEARDAIVVDDLAKTYRNEEKVVAVVNFFGMPLTFLSTGFMAAALMPAWMQALARGNPVNWAVNAGRDAMLGQEWAAVASYGAYLAIFTLVAGFLATRAFRIYRRAA